MLAAWGYTIHIAAGYKIDVKPDVNSASIAGLPCSSSAAGPHTVQSENVTLLLTSLFPIRARSPGWPRHSSALVELARFILNTVKVVLYINLKMAPYYDDDNDTKGIQICKNMRDVDKV